MLVVIMMKLFKWLLKSVLFGLITIFLFNILGQFVNLNVPVNVLTILIIGFLRIPGLAILVVMLNLF